MAIGFAFNSIMFMNDTQTFKHSSKKIILNWMPPASTNWPSPAMSILKGYLSYHHYSVEVEYWNLRFMKLQREFRWGNNLVSPDNAADIYLFYNYLAVYKNDHNAYEKIKAELKSTNPQFINVSDNFYDEHMSKYAKKVNDLFEKIIGTYDFSNVLYFGFEANLYQWIGSSILAEKIKQHCPSAITIIGGIGTKNTAIALLKNFPQFDIATWGEGESLLLHLTKIIRDQTFEELSEIGNIAYRFNNNIITSKVSSNNYINLSDPSMRPDFSDFFYLAQTYQVPQQNIDIPFEGSRSCHWKKCHFCYLNNGYKFRSKLPSILINEMIEAIEKYGVFSVMFLDNDLIINDFNRFDELLNGFIKIREKYPQFRINSAEVITNGLNAYYIKKMALSGFKSVQIGYESASDNLLRKIDKKNTFSSNLLFIKFAQKYKIEVVGANIIRYLYEETDDDIVESICNLHYLRFYYANEFFKHSLSRLAVSESSPYYRQGIAQNIKSMEIDYVALFLPENYILDETKVSLFEYIRPAHNILWDRFQKIDYHYTKHNFSYDFLGNNDAIVYVEYYDGIEINRLEFEKKSLEWSVLTLTNNEVLSFESLLELCQPDHDVNREKLIECIDTLYTERLLFHNSNYSENIAVVDVERII